MVVSEFKPEGSCNPQMAHITYRVQKDLSPKIGDTERS